jgi:hypothetical protein
MTRRPVKLPIENDSTYLTVATAGVFTSGAIPVRDQSVGKTGARGENEWDSSGVGKRARVPEGKYK